MRSSFPIDPLCREGVQRGRAEASDMVSCVEPGASLLAEKVRRPCCQILWIPRVAEVGGSSFHGGSPTAVLSSESEAMVEERLRLLLP